MSAKEPVRHGTDGRDAGLLRAMVDRIDQQDPGAFNNLGVLYFSKGMYAESVDAFLRALALDTRMRTAARNLEVAATRPGACDARLTALNERLANEPEDVGALRERARLLRLIGRHVEATQQLDALIAEDPDDGAALFERGLVEQRAGDLRRAQRWFERAINASATDAVARLHLAEVLYQRGQNEQALEALDAVLALDNSIADAHLLRGFVLGDMGRHEAAVAASRQAAALNPSLQALQPHLSIANEGVANEGATTEPEAAESQDNGLARYGLGLAFRQRGYFEEARREFQRALTHGEDARLARHAIAELDLIAGESASARRAYETLLVEQPDHARYWNEHGVALHQSGNVSGAADSYRRALRYDPRGALAYNNLGVALDDAGDSDAARDALTRASELDPTLVRARLNLATWHVRHHAPMQALSLLRELVAFHPDDADAWHALGVVSRDLNWLDESRSALARAVSARPSHAEARYALGHVLGALGDAEGALRETQQAMALSPVRRDARLGVMIELQRECPEACGALELLTVHESAPLTGIAIDDAQVASLLPDISDLAPASVEPAIVAQDSLARAAARCDEADQFAERGLQGEARERYARVRKEMEAEHAEPTSDGYATWRRAAVGEARCDCLLGNGERALVLLKRLGSHEGRDAEVLALFASSSAASGQPAPARTAIVRALRLEPQSAALMHFLGDVATRVNDDGLALGCYRRALALDPSRPSPRVSIARLLRTRGDLLAARLELVAALTAAPSLREAVLELALVHRDAGRTTEALSMLSAHLANAPTDLDALVLLAETLLQLERDDDARIAVSRVLRHDPAHEAALWIEGKLLARQSRMRDALDRWRRVADSESDSPLATQARQALAEATTPELRLVS